MIKTYLSIFRILTILSLTNIFSQEIPPEFQSFQIRKLFLDNGSKWEEKTIFGPIRFIYKNNTSDSLISTARFGTMFFNHKKMLYAYGHFTFKGNFHGYLYPRIVDSPDQFNRYSGVPRDIERGGFTSGETDISGISFQNNWMIFQFGRGRQSWGAGNDVQICLSENSNSYDYGMLDLDFGKLRVRYFHGYLETDSLANNRYITGRGIEWNNGKYLLFGLSEVIIYSGKDRPIDFAYFNPMSTHLEIELNDRQNNVGTGTGNGVWQLSLDYNLLERIRLSGNYLFDEFTLDKQQTDEGKGKGRAFSFRSTYQIYSRDESIISCYASLISVGTNTFKHQDGNNNFIQRGKPLGWNIGSDSEEIKTGLNALYNNKLIVNIEAGRRVLGEKNLLDDPYLGYTNYLAGQFPSGAIEDVSFASARLQWWIKSNFSFISEIKYNNSNMTGNDLELNIGIDVFYPFKSVL